MSNTKQLMNDINTANSTCSFHVQRSKLHDEGESNIKHLMTGMIKVTSQVLFIWREVNIMTEACQSLNT